MSKTKWTKIKSNLWRNRDSGQYYARVKVKGVDTWKTLETDLRSVADLKLPAALARIRAGKGALNGSSLTLAGCLEIYLDRLEERGFRRKRQSLYKKHKPRSLKYRRETAASLKANWPDFEARKAALVTDSECHAVADKIRRRFGATRYNGIIQTMRGVLDIAVEGGALEKNPSADVAFSAVRTREKFIPTREQTTAIWRELDSVPQRKYARLNVRAMAFTGLRPNEAMHVCERDIDLKRGTLTARETKNGQPRTIQLIPQAMDLLRDEGVREVVRALKKTPKHALSNIGKKLGMPLTPYTMRHLHMTALIESGVDISTAAAIAGHQDRGVTLLRHYAHARADHVKRQLTKVVI